MNYRTYSDMSLLVRNNISMLQVHKFDLIVGIPRSGMVPAYMVALYLNVHCCTIADLMENGRLEIDNSRLVKSNILHFQDAKNILIVDDSVNEGRKFREYLNSLPTNVRAKCKTLAIYATLKNYDFLDFYFEHLPVHVFEWHIFHRKNEVENSAFDLDGVLCDDPSVMEDDDGKKYVKFLENAVPKFIPTYQIHSIVTSRLEKYRSITEEWLRKNNVKYNQLIMLDLDSIREKNEIENCSAQYKADFYQKSDLLLFYESSFDEAHEIHRLTGKPVYCVATNEIIQNNSGLNFMRLSNRQRTESLKSVVRKIVNSDSKIYRVLRLIYRKVKFK